MCAGTLAFSVTVYTCVAIATVAIILMRRFCLNPAQELGGNRTVGYATFAVFLTLYATYLILSIMRSEDMVSLSYFASFTDVHSECR